MSASRLVLVHGAWGSPGIWDEVVLELEGQVEIVLADLPTMQRPTATFADDVEHVRSLVGSGPTVLCGHSYGGAVITEAADGVPSVAHLVYLAAAVPVEGETMFDITTRRPVPGVPLEFRDDGTAIPGAWGSDDGRYSAAAIARFAAVRPRPFAVAAAVTPLTTVAWRDVPSTYVLATRDQVIHPETQREMAERTGTVVEIDSDHVVTFQAPREVAAVLRSILASGGEDVHRGPEREEQAEAQ